MVLLSTTIELIQLSRFMSTYIAIRKVYTIIVIIIISMLHMHFLETETIVFYTIACESVQLNNNYYYRRLTIVYIDYNSFL